MSQWTKGKFIRRREPPPVLFVHGSPTASNVSLAGSGNGTAGPLAAGATLGTSLSGGSSGAAGAGMPVLSSGMLSRPASRLRKEVGSTTPLSGGSGGSGLEGGGGGGGIGLGSASGNDSPVPAAAAAFSMPLPLPLGRGVDRRSSSTRAADRADALWAEMQATLEEVELSASEGTRVFRPDHDAKLAELRQAQIALAQAWARSEADDTIETTLSADAAEAARLVRGSGGGGGTGAGNGLTRTTTADGEQLHPTMSNAARTTTTMTTGTTPTGIEATGGGGANTGGGAGETGGSTAGTPSATAAAAAAAAAAGMGGIGVAAVAQMEEEETQVDILLARKRREANDRYFQQVSGGVLDVVAKLDDVAAAMRAVEQESKDLFGDNEA